MTIQKIQQPNLKTQKMIMADDVQLSVYEWGESSPELETIILIHGYPDDASVWDKMAAKLSHNFHVVSYDVRGTGNSTAPISSKGYEFQYLLSDLNYVISQVSPKRKVHLLGRDWGALQGWEAVFDHDLQTKIQSYTALAPGLDHVGTWFRQHLLSLQPQQQWKAIKQMISSSYMGFFNLPILPELSWNAFLNKHWTKLLSKIEDQQLQHSSSHQLRNGINGLELYRKNLFSSLISQKHRITQVPVHVLSMRHDPFVPQHFLLGIEDTVDGLYKNTEIEAGHWGILTKIELFIEPISTFIFSIKSDDMLQA